MIPLHTSKLINWNNYCISPANLPPFRPSYTEVQTDLWRSSSLPSFSEPASKVVQVSWSIVLLWMFPRLQIPQDSICVHCSNLFVIFGLFLYKWLDLLLFYWSSDTAVDASYQFLFSSSYIFISDPFLPISWPLLHLQSFSPDFLLTMPLAAFFHNSRVF